MNNDTPDLVEVDPAPTVDVSCLSILREEGLYLGLVFILPSVAALLFSAFGISEQTQGRREFEVFSYIGLVLAVGFVTMGIVAIFLAVDAVRSRQLGRPWLGCVIQDHEFGTEIRLFDRSVVLSVIGITSFVAFVGGAVASIMMLWGFSPTVICAISLGAVVLCFCARWRWKPKSGTTVIIDFEQSRLFYHRIDRTETICSMELDSGPELVIDCNRRVTEEGFLSSYAYKLSLLNEDGARLLLYEFGDDQNAAIRTSRWLEKFGLRWEGEVLR